jgi:DNA-binding NarL/FixJ family response regulator
MIHAIDGVPRSQACRIVAFLANPTFRWLEASLRELESAEAVSVESASAWQPLEVLELRACDMAIVDHDFGGPALGLTLAEAILGESPAALIVLCREFDVRSTLAGSSRCALLHLPVHGGQLRLTIRHLLARQTLTASPASVRPSESRRSRLAAVASPTIDLERLRPREQQIVRLLLQHYRVPAIARALGITMSTVRNHLKNVYRRYGVHSQQDLLRAAAHRQAPHHTELAEVAEKR